MCSDHKTADGISRRGFAAMAATAGAGLSLLPMRALAAGAPVEALCVMCIDYRLVDQGVKFFDALRGPGWSLKGSYDLAVLAGASLASVSQMFPASVDALWNHVTIAHTLHAIKRVVVLDHRDCGAYRQEFGPLYNGDNGAGELAQHRGVMQRMKAQFLARGFDKFNLEMHFYLMSATAPYPIEPVIV
ncbi:MAG TPA: hypothetical protein VHZ78_11850 [Rhizomicrobium sp.]|nr:hypothetical protein [Rhizomicrobium sp.]